MFKSFKKYWWLFAVVTIIFPLLLNYLLLIPAFTPIVGNSDIWLSFWATFLGAIASFGMIFFTAITLNQNNAQLEELKRQWEEDHRPHIVFDLICQSGMYLLRIRNIGKYDATNIKLEINKEYYDNLLNDSLRYMMDDFRSKALHIESGGIRYIQIGVIPNFTPCYFYIPREITVTKDIAEAWLRDHRNDSLILRATYNETYESNAVLKLSDFPEYSLDLIDSEIKALDAINNRLRVIERGLKNLKVSIKE